LCGFIFLLLAFASQAELPKTFDIDNDLILVQLMANQYNGLDGRYGLFGSC